MTENKNDVNANSIDGMKFLETIYEKAQAIKPTIILADAQDERVLRATKIIEEFNVANIILLGNTAELLKMQRELDLTLKAKIFDNLIENNGEYKSLHNNSELAALLVKQNKADGFVAGNISTTKDTILAAKNNLSTKEFQSSYFIIIHKNVPMFFADCAYHINPTEQELAKIAIATADCAKEMGITPHIAFLSFSTYGSADHEHVNKVRTATELAKKLAPHYQIEGELQFDAAFNAEIAAIKSQDKSKSKIHKTANIFIFPDLNSGNIAYKIAAHMGGSVAIGPILYGFSHPISDLSRGCKVEDIVNAVAVISSQVKKK